MDDAATFEVVLDELRQVIVASSAAGLEVLLIGGQVLAVLMRQQTGSGEVSLQTPTGLSLTRGYTLEPDLLVEVGEEGTEHGRLDLLPEVLRQCGFERARPDTRWSKQTRGVIVLLDLFAPATTPEDTKPTTMTSLVRSELAQTRAQLVRVPLSAGTLEVHVPNALGFLALKTEAKLRIRPQATKDSFDAYAYVLLVGVEAVVHDMGQDIQNGRTVANELRVLFGTRESAGVQDVVAHAGLYDTEGDALLAQSVVDTFAEVDQRLEATFANPDR